MILIRERRTVNDKEIFISGILYIGSQIWKVPKGPGGLHE